MTKPSSSLDFLGLCKTVRNKINSWKVVVKLWNGSEALQISRNGLDCKTDGLMIYKTPIHAPEKKIIFRKFVLGHYRATICKQDWQGPLSVFHTDLAAKLVETRPDTQLLCGWAGATFEVTRPFRQGQWGQRNEIIKRSKIGTNRLTDRWTKLVVESLARDKKRGGKQEEGSLSLNHP